MMIQHIHCLCWFRAMVCCFLLLLGGCASDNHTDTQTLFVKPPEQVLINHVHFALPKNITWVQTTNQQQSGNISNEWVIQSFNPVTTPVGFAYQRLKTNMNMSQFIEQLVKPYQNRCNDVEIFPLLIKNAYPQTVGVELICAEFAKSGYGVLADAVIFSDGYAMHLLLSEVKTLPAKRAGELAVFNDQQKQQAQRSQQLSQMMLATLNAIKVCDNHQQCY